MFRSRDVGPVRTMTIDNPERRNAIPADQWLALAEAIEDFEASEARVLVITGADEHFCSGVDIGSGATEGGVAGWYRSMSEVSRAATAIHSTTKPTIAAVDGVAVGAGMNLALGCDIVLATERSRFGEVFVKRGLTLDFGGTWLLPRRVGMARAKEIALTGRMVSAGEAAEYGIVSRVVADDALAAETGVLAEELAAGAPLAQRLIKAGLDRSFEMTFAEGLEYERVAQSVLLTTHDAAEGFVSFLQKRPPEFRGE